MYYTSYSDFLDFLDSFVLEVEEFEKRQETPKLPRPQPKMTILVINEGTPFPSGRSPPFFAPGRGYNFVITIDIFNRVCYNNIVIKRKKREKKWILIPPSGFFSLSLFLARLFPHFLTDNA